MRINGNKNYIDNRERERERERERDREYGLLIDGGTLLVIQFLGDNTELLPLYY